MNHITTNKKSHRSLTLEFILFHILYCTTKVQIIQFYVLFHLVNLNIKFYKITILKNAEQTTKTDVLIFTNNI